MVIPLYNEQEVLEKNLDQFLEIFCFEGEWELLLVDNRSQDNTLSLAEDYARKHPHIHIRVICTQERGIGVALRTGFDQARGELIFWGAADFAYGFDVVDKHLAGFFDCDLLIGSKYLPQSNNKTPIIRRFLSFFLHCLLFFIFNCKVSDPQGSLLFKKEVWERIKKHCPSGNAFFETQFVLYTPLYGFVVKEIPFDCQSSKRKSRFSIFKESFRVCKDLVNEAGRFYRVKRSLS